jgi:CheY-like chemotaxis protein
LAEDNPVNQRVAVGLLEKRGHRVTVVSTGMQAVAAALEQAFDAVLMDVQMPEMDGLEATAAIRQSEQSSSKRTKIIAMTAHAMKGDRERCLEAGMDGYISKPLNAETLYAVVESQDKATTQPPAPAPAVAEPPPFDINALRAYFGDEVLLKEVAGVFLDSCPAWQSEIRNAIDAGDAARLKLVVHTLKGAVSHFADQPSYNAVQKLEMLARDGQLADAPAVCAALDRAVERLRAALQALCRSLNSD